MPDYVFHRDFSKSYPLIERAEGIYLYDKSGKRYIDASSGAIAANLGHGLTEIIDAMNEQARKAAFVHTLRFETEVQHLLAQEIAEAAPGPLNRVYFASGGAEANESAIKLAYQYHAGRGKASKQIVVGRWQSYHGNTLGALSAGGDIKRRKLYTALLNRTAHIHSPFCSHCPYMSDLTRCENEGYVCVKALSALIEEIGAENISAFIVEPIVGSQQGAVVPPANYLEQVRRICTENDILLIFDEVMTGFCRTGKFFALEHFGAVPDIVTFGKGVTAGYAPLSGMIVHDRIVEGIIANSGGKFTHGYTYSGHPVSVAAGLAAVRYYKRNRIADNAREMGAYLTEKLLQLAEKYRTIGEIRGKGLLIGVELVRDRRGGKLFEPSLQAAERFNKLAMEAGIVLYPGSGGIDGRHGEHFLIAPRLNTNRAELDEILEILDHVFAKFENSITL